MTNIGGKTILQFARRSNAHIILVTLVFAMAPTIAILIAPSSSRFGPIDGLWIPLSFIVIPTIHYLCKEVLTLRERLEKLEKEHK